MALTLWTMLPVRTCSRSSPIAIVARHRLQRDFGEPAKA
jgi:hypothetical protein